MGTQATATCPECGDVKLDIPDIKVISDREDQRKAYYNFICPSPDHRVRISSPAKPRIINLLVANGCEVVYIDLDLQDDVDAHNVINESYARPSDSEVADFSIDMNSETDLTPVDIVGSLIGSLVEEAQISLGVKHQPKHISTNQSLSEDTNYNPKHLS